MDRICRHCSRPTRRAGRGLCWRCWRDRAIRDRYAVVAQFSGGDAGRMGREVQLRKLTSPTSARIGTEERIAVMQQRAEQRLPTKVDGDAER